jgi:hypothetical protein
MSNQYKGCPKSPQTKQIGFTLKYSIFVQITPEKVHKYIETHEFPSQKVSGSKLFSKKIFSKMKFFFFGAKVLKSSFHYTYFFS